MTQFSSQSPDPQYHPYFRIERPLLIAAVVSLAAMSYAALPGQDTFDAKILSAAASALFAQTMIWTSAHATAPRKTLGHDHLQRLPALTVLRETTRLTAISLLWSAGALLLAYPIIGLKWQHGWQYGLGSAVLSLLFAHYAQRIANTADPLAQPGAVENARRLAGVFAAAVFVASAWLALSGKLLTVKNDWLANNVFLAIACAVFMISVFAVTRARQR